MFYFSFGVGFGFSDLEIPLSGRPLRRIKKFDKMAETTYKLQFAYTYVHTYSYFLIYNDCMIFPKIPYPYEKYDSVHTGEPERDAISISKFIPKFPLETYLSYFKNGPLQFWHRIPIHQPRKYP